MEGKTASDDFEDASNSLNKNLYRDEEQAAHYIICHSKISDASTTPEDYHTINLTLKNFEEWEKELPEKAKMFQGKKLPFDSAFAGHFSLRE